MLTWLVILALLWPFFWGLRVLLVTKALVGLEFQRQRVVPVPAEEIPPHLREAAQPWMVQFDALGFQVLGGWRGDPGARRKQQRRRSRVARAGGAVTAAGQA